MGTQQLRYSANIDRSRRLTEKSTLQVLQPLEKYQRFMALRGILERAMKYVSLPGK